MSIKAHWLNWRQIILDDPNLSFGAKGMAMFLNTYMNDSQDMAFPSIATICGRLNISDKTATKYTDELEANEYLLKNGRFGKTTQYVAILPSNIVESPKLDDPPVSETLRSSFVKSPTPVSETLRTNNQDNNQSNNQVYMSGNGKDSENAKKILSFLNEKTGRNYKPVPSNLRLISARLKEHSEEELRMMVAKKSREWGDDNKMRDYLRPLTLFNASKCAQYVGELG